MKHFYSNLKLFLVALFALAGLSARADVTITYGLERGTFYKTDGTEVTSGFCGKWVSTATDPQLTVSVSANNINSADGAIYSGSSGCTYTLTTQPGYIITGYTLVGTANGGAQTLTPSGGEAKEFPVGQETTLVVADLASQITSFNQSTPNSGIIISSFTITIAEDPSYVDPNVAYVGKQLKLNCKRGYVAGDGTKIFGTADEADASIFAVVTYEENNYLFDVTNKTFVCHTSDAKAGTTGNNALESDKDFSKIVKGITFGQTGIEAYPYYLEDSWTNWLNMDGSKTLYMNTWKNFEGGNGGNTYAITVVDDFDATEAIDMLDAYFHPTTTVVYVISDTHGEVFRSVAAPSTPGETISTLPEALKRSYCNYEVTPTVIVSGENEVPVTVSYSLPFKLSANIEQATWYYATIRSTKYLRIDENAKDGSGRYQTSATNTFGDEFQWAFVGNPYNLMIANKGAGKFLYADNQPQVRDFAADDNKFVWAVSPNTSEGFSVRSITGANLYINDAGNNGNLGYWDSAYGANDPGSKWTVSEVLPILVDQLTNEIETAEGMKTESRTVGLEAFNQAIADAIAAKESTNGDDILDAIESLKAAELVFLKANLLLAEGTYYIYNPLTKKFLSRGNAYGTAAVVDDYGVAINVTAGSDFNYTLKGFDNNLPYGFDEWMYSDSNGNNVRTFALTEVEGGYTLTNTNNDKLVYVSLADGDDYHRVAGNAIKDDNYTDDAQTVWKFVTPAERNAIVAAREAAEKTAAFEAAGFNEQADVQLTDATELTFTTGSAWVQKVVRTQDNQPATNDNGTEMWQATGNYTQSVAELESGLYKLSIQAFYRNGGADECAQRYATGYNTIQAYLEANGTKIQVKSWAADKGEGNDPNSMAAAKAKFDEGKYLAEGYAYVGEDGILNLKVNNPSHIGNGWFIVNNVKYAKVLQDALLADAEALAAADENAVAVGKLLDAIEAYKVDGDTAPLKLAMEKFLQDNADIEQDMTAKVATNGWKKFEGNEAAGVCGTQYAPAITTYDGRNAQLAEVFENTCATTGQILYQDITGLPNGTYKVGFYGNAFSTAKRDNMECDLPEDGADDVAYVFANDQQAFIHAVYATSTETNDFRQFDVEVKDGTIKLGMAKAKAGTNWHTMQIYQLTWFTTAKEAYNALRDEIQAKLIVANALVTDVYKTEGKDALQTAINAANAAIVSNKLNCDDFSAEIAALQSAIDAFKKANYATFTGTFYIQAPSGKYMAAGHDWGTRGIVNEAGLDLTLSTIEDKKVTFDSQVANSETNHFLNAGLYMDGAAYGWILDQVGADTYTISDGTQYIGVDGNDNLVMQNEAVAWKIIAAADVQAARLAALEAATAENGVDATFLIKGANFNRNDGRNEGWTKWSQQENGDENLTISNGNNVNNCAESFHAHFYVKQAIQNAPKGLYKLTAQGFYRQDDEAVEDGAVFFIGDQTAAVPLKTGEEGSMSAASESFTEGLYTIDPIEFVFTEGDSFEVGVKNETAFHQWIIFDNFQLTYYGPAEAPATDAQAPELSNPSFELAAAETALSEEKKATNGPLAIYGWTEVVDDSYNNTELRPAGSTSNTSQFGTSDPSDGDYSLFIRHGWNNGSTTVTLTSDALAEIPAGDYTLSVDYKQHYSYDNQQNENTKVTIALVNGEEILGSETSPAAEGVSGGSGDATYFNDAEWSTLTASFTLDEPVAAGAKVVITLAARGQRRSDFFLDNVQFVKIPGVEAAKSELQKAIEAAQAEVAKYTVGEDLFMYPESEIAPLTTAIATATEAYNDEQATKESVNAATEALNDAVAAFAPAFNAPDADKLYTFELRLDGEDPLYMNLGEGITIAEEATALKFIATENAGQYYLANEDETLFVGLAGGNAWTMSTAADKKAAWTFTALGEGAYRINNLVTVGRFVGTNAADKAAGSSCFADKQTSNGNVDWLIAEYVAPTPQPVVPTLANADFEGEYTVFASPSADRDVYQPAGWTVTYENGDGNDMTALNSGDKAWNNFSGRPQLGEAGGNNSYWVRFRWGDSETLTLSQQVTLSAGNYRLSADAFFNGADGASATISAAGQSTAITGNSTWANHKLVFTVTEEGPVTIALNVTQTKQVENVAAFDNVKLEAYEPLDGAKNELQAAITAAKAIETDGKAGVEELNEAITAAENALNDAEATAESLAAAKDALNDAVAEFNDANITVPALAGWTRVRTADIENTADNYYVLVDANSLNYVMSNEADHYRPCYKTVADPVANPSFVWTLEGSDNTFALKSFSTGAYFIVPSNGWDTSMTGSTGSATYQFTLNDGVYSIKCVQSNGLVGHWNDSGAAVANDGENIAANKQAKDAPGFYLFAISKDTYNNAILAARTEATAGASKENPIDVTEWIQNADWSGDFGGWARSGSWGNMQWGKQTLEVWNASNVVVKQTLTGVPDGTYKLTADVISGNDDNKVAYVFGICGSTVNSDPVSAVASAGNYDTMSAEVAGNTLTADNIVVTGGELTVGLDIAAGWVVADNFKLYYMGDSAVPVGINDMKGATNVGTIYDLSGRKVEKMQKGIYIVNGKKVSIK